MFANRDRVLKRVTEILNLCIGGRYSAALSPRNKTRNVEAIADATDEAGLILASALAEYPNEFRSWQAEDVMITDSGALLPSHLGPLVAVQILLWPGGPTREGKKEDYRKVTSWRENPNLVYDAVAHDVANSTLAGAYAVWEDRFHFTGKSATVTLVPPPIRDMLEAILPECMESIWIRLAVGNNGKVGTGDYQSGLVGAYWNQGMADLEAFKSGRRVFSEVDEPKGDDMHARG